MQIRGFLETSKSGHEIDLFQPDVAVKAIRDAVTAVRTRKPLQ